MSILPDPISPSFKLPVELLSEIFLLCVDESVDDQNTIKTPLLLSSICSRWRSAAISNPQLWSRLFIQLVGISSKSTSALVDTWLTRSSAFPLTVYLFWEKGPFADTHPVLQKLMEHSQRWHTMFFYIPYRAFRSFSCIRTRLPMLSNLSLGTEPDRHLPASFYGMGPRNQLDMFEESPNLQSLECINFSPLILRFPWSQLHDIPVISGNIDDCLEILRRATHLSKISIVFVEGVPLPSTPMVNHIHLTCLTIMTPPWNEYPDLSMLFPRLSLPHLETLNICNLRSVFGNEFTQFLSRLPALTTLHLRKTVLPDEQLVDCLKHVSSLRHLMVISHSGCTQGGTQREPTVTRYLLDALTRNFFSSDAMDGMLLPRLQRLELTVSEAVARELDPFMDMLQSRLRDDDGLSRLEHVRVRPCVELNHEFLVRLIELRTLGLDVVLEDC